MHESIFAELSLIIAIGAGMSIFMRLIRQPLIIGHIITGLIVGPTALHLIKSADTINAFSSIGIALLLFIIGLGLNPRVIREVGKVAAITGGIQVFLSTVIGYGAGLILGYSKTESLFFGVALAFSSTIIILKLLSDKREQTRLYGKVLTGILIIQDVLAAVALLFVTAKGTEHGFTVNELSWLVLKGAAIAIPLFFIGVVVLPRIHKFIAGSQELLFLFAIGWGFGFAALFEHAGFSLEMGALLSGVALATLPYAQEISARLRPLRDFFIIVFFIALGARISFANFSEILPAIIIGTFVVVIVKPLIVLAIMGFMGYTKRTSFKAAVATAQVSEFSLVFIILGSNLNLLNDNLVSIITIVSLISIAASAYMIIYSDKLYDLFEADLSMFERRKELRKEHNHKRTFDIVLFGYHKGGQEFVKVFDSLKHNYVVVDYDPDVIDILEHQKIEYIYGDVTDIELLEEIGLEKPKLVVSTITDFDCTVFLVRTLAHKNPRAVIICHADNVAEAEELYNLGVTYVMMPHYIGSEKISRLIKRSELKKSEFKPLREKHLEYLHSHYEDEFELEGAT